MRHLSLVLLALCANSSAAGQSIVALTPCCANAVVTVDPLTGGSTTVAEVGTALDLFIASVGSVAIDIEGQRGFLVRNGRFTVAGLASGAVTEGPEASSIMQLAGFDTARDQLLAFATEIVVENESPLTRRFTNYIVAYRPATQDTIRIAKVGEELLPTGPGDPSD